jgi:predicted DNA-binding transcriptional regulator YafY
MNRTDRLLAIILELQAKGWQRAEDLAETFEISKRTVYRDMLALAESGVPVVSVPGQGYSLVEGYFLPPLSFSTDEAMILLLGADFMAQNFDAQYRIAANSATRKIEAILPEALRQDVAYLQSSIKFVAYNPLNDAIRPEILQRIRRAIIQRKRVHFEYHTRSADDPENAVNVRDADPYGLVNYSSAWYMIAYCHLRHDVRNFRLDRIDRLNLLDTTFSRPVNFQLRQEGPRGRKVVVRALFDYEVARWVREERNFFTAAEEETLDGLLITYKVRQERDVLPWLMRWGRHVRVLEPDSLRQQMIEEAEAILENHKIADMLLT